MGAESRKPLHWIGSSLKDSKAMPVPVQKTFGTALRDVQYGEKPDIAKALSGSEAAACSSWSRTMTEERSARSTP